MAQLMATTDLSDRSRARARLSPARGFAWLFGALVWAAAGLIGAALALFLGMMVIAIAAASSLLLGLATAAVRARRAFEARGESGLIEAHRIGGHSWVAYGWDWDA